MSLHTRIEGEAWKTCLGTILGTWLIVWIFAALHNQYLIRIHPEHFTVWHYRIPLTPDHTLLAILYALGASITPGLVLGLCLYGSGRLFPPPKMPVGQILRGVAAVAVATEICALLAGFAAWRKQGGIYPADFYPDDTVGLGITQSIQITAYLSGAMFSLILLARVWWWRLSRRRNGVRVQP